MRRGKGFSASPAQRLKVRGVPCRYCRQGESSDPAHVTPRSMGGCNQPECVIPLCRAHHTAYDQGALSVLEILTLEEQAHAVSHVGIARAWWRTTNERKAA